MAKRTSVDLSGKNAIVTGGGGVLCSGFAKELAACGASVAVCDLRLEAAQAVADEINISGGVAIAVEAVSYTPLDVYKRQRLLSV